MKLLSLAILAALGLAAGRAAEARTLYISTNADKPHYIAKKDAAMDGLVVADYGDAVLLRAFAEPSLGARRLGNTIGFESGRLDPATADLSEPGDPSLLAIQFFGPPTTDVLETLAGRGASFVSALSGHTFVFSASPAVREQLVAFAESEPLVRAAFEYPHRAKFAGNKRVIEGDAVRVTVQVPSDRKDSKRSVELLSASHEAPWDRVRDLESTTILIAKERLDALSLIPGVFAIEPKHPFRLMDEVQAQIVAGNFAHHRGVVGGPGYMAWLEKKGFDEAGTEFPQVEIIDDGIADGSLLISDVSLSLAGEGDVSRVVSSRNCTSDPLGDSGGGHGHLNASILGGHGPAIEWLGIQFPVEDQNGYKRGLGVNPYVRLSSTKIANNDGFLDLSECDESFASVIKGAQDARSEITSNSWGEVGNSDYDATAQLYDLTTRDADAKELDDQPMLHVVAAGNDGFVLGTISSPGTAKSVITVGASENVRPHDEDGLWTDGCGYASVHADAPLDMTGFSSRGPAEGARVKPELVAPGTHVQGTRSTSASFVDQSAKLGICDEFRPDKQDHFAASSGTSQATPAVAGAASLAWAWLRKKFSIEQPSPALVKGFLIAHTRYMSGAWANTPLPSHDQGFGLPNLSRAFDEDLGMFVWNQDVILGSTGQTFSVPAGTVDDPTKPVAVVLVWSDVPGAIADDSPTVNDLDLTVSVNGEQYVGNHFEHQYSSKGPWPSDDRNTTEVIYLPPGSAGDISLSVYAAAINGDGVPGVGDQLDQDFALVCSNCRWEDDPEGSHQ